MPWDPNLAAGDDIVVLCGERCASTFLSRSLGEWKQVDLWEARSGMELTAA